jgi:hypothetical protein
LAARSRSSSRLGGQLLPLEAPLARELGLRQPDEIVAGAPHQLLRDVGEGVLHAVEQGFRLGLPLRLGLGEESPRRAAAPAGEEKAQHKTQREAYRNA